MGAPLWLRYGVGGLSRLSPSRAAALASAFFRKPSLTMALDAEDLARLGRAEALMRRGETGETIVEGRRLRHFRFRASGPARGLALLLHGWSGDARAMAAFLAPLAEAGYDALAVDLPAHGGSCGEETDAAEAARLVAGLLSALRLRPDHVIAHSYGGAVAGLMTGHACAPRGLVSIAAPARFDLIADEIQALFGLSAAARVRFEALTAAQLGRPVATLDAARLWERLPTRILVLHAPEDRRVGFAHATHFATAANVRLAPLTGVDHCGIVYDPRAIRAAMDHILALDGAEVGPLARAA